MRVFVIDDHPIVQYGVQALLEPHNNIEMVGYADDGADAVHAIRELQPDIILTDLSMPGLNGMQIIQEFRHIKIICMSGYLSTKISEDLILAGAKGLLSKTSLIVDLIECLYVVSIGGTYIDKSFDDRTRQKLSMFSGRPDINNLSSREIEILHMITLGLQNKEIANALGISYRTVENHRVHILHKTGLKNAVELTHYAFQMGYSKIMDFVAS